MQFRIRLAQQISLGLVLVFKVGIGFFGIFSVFLKVGSVFGIGISKYRDIGISILLKFALL